MPLGYLVDKNALPDLILHVEDPFADLVDRFAPAGQVFTRFDQGCIGKQ